MRARWLPLCLVFSMACDCSPPPPPVEKRALKVLKIVPDLIFPEGGDVVRVPLENGCGKDLLTASIDGLALSNLTLDGLVSFSFTAPPSRLPDTRHPVSVDVRCSAPPPGVTWQYADGGGVASGGVTYEGAENINPVVKNFAPVSVDVPGEGPISVLSRLVVSFSRPIDPATVTPETFRIDGVSGRIVASSDNRTFTFEPAAQLKYDTLYTCVVTTGVASLKGHKAVSTTIAPPGKAIDPNANRWVFRTRCQGCMNPWIGDISAAAGISTGGGYTLFSVTGQPSPVGEASNGTYKLQSGFIFAVQPGSGP